MKRLCTALVLAVAAPLVLSPSPAAAIPVFDAGNYAQNLLQAARALEQINHQIESLQNEAKMIERMERNLERIDFPQLERIRDAMQRIDGLMEEAQGIGFRVDRLDERLRTLFPGASGVAPSGDQRILAARARLEAATAGFRRAMSVQAQVVENVRRDAGLLDELAERSQGAVGALQARQAASQLLALSIKQQLQLQTLMAAEFREASIGRARRAQLEAEGRAATSRFLGTRQAYTPRGD